MLSETLEHLFGEGDAFEVAAIRDGVISSERFLYQEIGAAVTWVESRSENLYVCLNPVGPGVQPGFRVKREQIAETRWLMFDVDPEEGGTQEDTLEVTDALTEWLKARGAGGLVFMFSGRGYQVWLRHESRPGDALRDVRKRLRKGLAKLLGTKHARLDATDDSTRLARLPGTLNLKSGEEARILCVTKGVCSISDLEAMADEVCPVRSSPVQSGPTTRQSHDGHTDNPYVQAALAGAIQEIASAPEGQRNTTALKVSYSLGGLAEWLHAAQAIPLLAQAAMAAGLEESEALSVVERGWAKGAESPRSIPERAHTPKAPQNFEQKKPESARGLSPVSVVALAQGGLEVHDRASRGIIGPRWKTGLGNLDWQLRGLRPGQLTLIGARPSVGKTALLIRLLLGLASLGARCGFLSLEASEEELQLSVLSIWGKVPRYALEDGKLTLEQLNAATSVAKDMEHWKGCLEILAPARVPTATGLVETMRAMQSELKLDVIALDYIQRVATDAGDSKVGALEALSLGVTAFAKQTGCHVLAAAQLNRESEHRGKNAQPRMADLKGSGQFEQDAHNVLLLHRPNKDSENAEKPDDRAYLLVAKHRNGRTGVVKLSWDGPTLHFGDRVWDK